MRRGCLGRRFRPPRLEHDDRLGQRHLTRGRQERARIADRFHVNHDALGIRVITEIIDQVAPADIKHRADRDERTESDVRSEAPVEDGRAQGAALADETDRTRPSGLSGKGRVHAAVRSHHAHAVGPDDSHPPPACLLEQLLLEPSPFRTAFLEAGRDHDRSGHTGINTFADHAGHRRRRRDHHRQIDRVGD